MQLKKIDELILQDIRDHPGSSQNQVVQRLSEHYRAREYVRLNIVRLVKIGMIRDEGNSQAACLKCVS